MSPFRLTANHATLKNLVSSLPHIPPPYKLRSKRSRSHTMDLFVILTSTGWFEQAERTPYHDSKLNSLTSV